MSIEKEKAQLMFKLAFSKKNWGAKYDRLEHYKRFQNLKQIIKELVKKNWMCIQNKPTFTSISLNPAYKKEILEFIEHEMPHVKGMIK
ncbi:MAG: hypothetical protein AABX88_00875 [Nanoarchaeota archaeon]